MWIYGGKPELSSLMANEELGNTAICIEGYVWKGLDTSHITTGGIGPGNNSGTGSTDVNKPESTKTTLPMTEPSNLEPSMKPEWKAVCCKGYFDIR